MVQRWIPAHTPRPPPTRQTLPHNAHRPRSFISELFILLIMMTIFERKGEGQLIPGLGSLLGSSANKADHSQNPRSLWTGGFAYIFSSPPFFLFFFNILLFLMHVSVDGHPECLQLTSTDAATPLSLERGAGMGELGARAQPWRCSALFRGSAGSRLHSTPWNKL